MGHRELTLIDDAEAVERLARVLAASVNVPILRVLAEERSRDPRGGWMYLSDIASRIGQAPGTVSVAIQKLSPLLEERREKGKRYFRSRVRGIRIRLDVWEGEADPLASAL